MTIMTQYCNKYKIINKIFKILYIFEENQKNYIKYLQRVTVELLGYVEDDNLDILEKEALYETIVALKGLIKLDPEETTHTIVRKIVLHHVNKLQVKLK